MSKFYSVGWIVNLSNKMAASNVFIIFHSTGSNFLKIKTFSIFLSLLCVFYILHRKIKNPQFYRVTFPDYPKYYTNSTIFSWNMDNSRHATTPNSDHPQGYLNVSTR